MFGGIMATTFKVQNGDVVIKNITGRPSMIGNVVGAYDAGQARDKTAQDLRRCLSISRLKDGSGAGINDLVGILDGGGGFASVAILVKSRIRSMFTSICALQRKRVNVRPPNEQFKDISALIVTQLSDKTSYKFRLDTKTVAGGTITQSGTIQG
jgi:hypothetical protein